MDITFGHDEGLIRCWWPSSNFQGHSGAKYVKFKPNRACVPDIWLVVVGVGDLFSL